MDLLLHLRAFCAVAEQRSFTRAAAVLGVPQPVVSRRVAALERHLGGRLLVRDPRGVVPNDLGRTLLPHAQDLQVRAEHLLEVARAAGSDLTWWLPEGAAARDLLPARTAAAGLGLRVELVVAAPEQRERALGGAVPGLSVIACAADEADMTGALGAGTREPVDRSFHLDTLRPPRRSGRPGRRVHLGPEDDRPWVRDVVRRHAARAGLSPHQVVVGTPPLSAAADVHEHDDVWLCTEAEARAHDVAWREVADLPVARHYRLATGRAGAAAVSPAQRRQLAVALAPALGLRSTREATS